MKCFFALYKKDIRALFGSPLAYVFLTAFSLLTGLFFYRGMLFFSAVSVGAGRSPALNVNGAVFQPLYSNYVFVLVLLVPLLTMRLFSEERKSGTLELISSYPVRPPAVALAKYACGLTAASSGLALTVLYPAITSFIGKVEWAPVASAYLGLFLTASALVAIGAFFSSVTDNQIIAASSALGASSVFWIVGWIARYMPAPLGRLVDGISLHERTADFIRGVVNTDDLFFFLNITAAALIFTVMSLRSQRFGG